MPALRTYRALLWGFVAFLALTLLTLVDIRRGFLFAAYPVRTLFYALNPWHALMLAAGIAGMIACVRGARRLEAAAGDTSRLLTPLTLVILGLLVADLFTYRGVPAARSIAAGRVNVDWLKAFGVTAWWRPFAQATSYALNVWHATLIGILLSGLALTMLPAFMQRRMGRGGFGGSLLGAAFAIPQPFCSCCSSVMAPTLARRGASTNFLLAFIIGAPMLNVTTIALAAALLPVPFAITRIAAGVVVSVLVTYVVARMADRWDGPGMAVRETTAQAGLIERIGGVYQRLFDVDRILQRGAARTPTAMIGTWAYASGRIALVLVPTLWAWSVVAAALFAALPGAFGNNLPSVLVAAIGGTFFMISTWSEIPMALQLIERGYNGPAAALLVVLPAISLPCMMLLGGALQRFRLVALLSAAVAAVGIVTGVMFL